LQVEDRRKTLIEFLLAGEGVAPDVELEIDRPQGCDEHRDVVF
jgi:hypothetical protein